MTGESHFRKTTLRLILLGVSLTIGFLAADLIVRYVFFNPVCEYSGSGLKIQLSPEMLYTIVPDSRLGRSARSTGPRSRDRRFPAPRADAAQWAVHPMPSSAQ